MFTKRNDPLLESANKAIAYGNITRFVTEGFNKELGIFHRNELPNEAKPIYDKALKSLIKEHVDSGRNNYDINHNKNVENRELAILTRSDKDDDEDDKKKKKHVKEAISRMKADKPVCEDSVEEATLTPFQQAFADARAAAKAAGNASGGTFKFEKDGVAKDYQTNIKGEKYKPQSKLVDYGALAKNKTTPAPAEPASTTRSLGGGTSTPAKPSVPLPTPNPNTPGAAKLPSSEEDKKTIDDMKGAPETQSTPPKRSGFNRGKPESSSQTFKRKYDATSKDDQPEVVKPASVSPASPAKSFVATGKAGGIGSDAGASAIAARSSFKPAETMLPPVEVDKPSMLSTRAAVPPVVNKGSDANSGNAVKSDKENAPASFNDRFNAAPANSGNAVKGDKLTPNYAPTGPGSGGYAPTVTDEPVRSRPSIKELQEEVKPVAAPKKKYQSLSSTIRQTLEKNASNI